MTKKIATKQVKKRAVKQRGNSAKSRRGKPFKKGNPHAFKPGRSGNPKGRPKSIVLSEAYRRALAQPFPDDPDGRTFAEVIAEKMVISAAAGDVAPAREIADRTEGKPRQMLDVDLNLMDWRQMALANGLNEEDVLAEAKRLIKSTAAASSAKSD